MCDSIRLAHAGDAARVAEFYAPHVIHRPTTFELVPPPAEGLHRAIGFETVGVYRNAGFKLGAWHDVTALGLALRPAPPGVTPAPPRALPELLAAGEWLELT